MMMRPATAPTTVRAPEGRRMWFGVSESVLQSAAVLPIQFQDIWSRSRSISAERSLALAVLQEALNDLVRYRFAARRRGQRLFWEAYAWIAANDRDWPYSFVNLCDSLGLPLEATRRQVLDSPAPVLAAVMKAETTVEAALGKAA